MHFVERHTDRGKRIKCRVLPFFGEREGGNMKTRLFWINTAKLAASAMAVRIVGIAWNARLSLRVGAEAIGLLSLVMNVYALALTCVTAGVGVAVTRLVAEAGEREPERIPAVLRRAMSYVLALGASVSLLLLLLSPAIAEHLLGDARASLALRAASISVLPCGVSAVLTGYFTAMRSTTPSALSQVLGQAVRIAAVSSLLVSFLPRGVGHATLAVTLGGAIAELVSCLLLLLSYLRSRDTALPVYTGREVLPMFLHITLPLSASACLRSLLTTCEHLLIPRALARGGHGGEGGLAAYGRLVGMAIPLVLFPMALLSAAGSLLVPELSARRASGDMDGVRRLASRALFRTAVFGAAVSCLLWLFGGRLAALIYGSEAAGLYVRLLAPIVPAMFADHVTDHILKGVGEQVASMWINIFDALFSIALVMLLLPPLGPSGYVLVIATAELVNFTLSFARMERVLRLGRGRRISASIPAPLDKCGKRDYNSISL